MSEHLDPYFEVRGRGRILAHKRLPLHVRLRARRAAFGGDGFSFRATLLWGVALLLALSTHLAGAVVILSWSSPVPSIGEPPPAVLIDLPAVARQSREESEPAFQQSQNDATDQIPAAEDRETADGGASIAPRPAPSVPAPAAAVAAMPQPVSRSRKPQKSVQKPARHERSPAAPPRRSVRPADVAEDSPAAAPAERQLASIASAAVDVPSTWKSDLLARIERCKRYPDAARAERGSGTALLSFTIDRDGNVLDSFISRSSGFTSLDEETLAMLRRAAPLPKIPDYVRGDSLQLVVPVRFSVQ